MSARGEMVAVDAERRVTLGALVDALGPLAVASIDAAAAALRISGIAVDSRLVRPGDVFVALRGATVDGHAYVPDALRRGAAAVVAERASPASVPCVVVTDSAKALAKIASRFYGDPADSLHLCGVTGTNGKTSTSHILRAIMDRAGRRMGIIGTLGHGVERLTRSLHTTPDSPALHALLREMADQRCYGVVMEVSSHAVRQHRTWGLDFSVGILTNITHDHLDYHADMSDYKAAKAEFCYSLAAEDRRKPAGTLVYWIDDPSAREIGGAFRGRGIAVGTAAGADWRVRDVQVSLEATRFTIEPPGGDRLAVAMKLLGGFVPANAALAAAAASAMGATADHVRAGLEGIDRVPGRFEAMGGRGHPVVVVDYAHTPDGFERVLATCRSLGPKRLVTVFGCGGDRDRSKRAVMGAIAQRSSERCYITMDNPRTERIEQIVEDILAGMRPAPDVTVELDRSRAIKRAIAEAGCGDIVALLGKGHEEYQIVGTEKRPFSDRAEAEEALREWRAR